MVLLLRHGWRRLGFLANDQRRLDFALQPFRVAPHVQPGEFLTAFDLAAEAHVVGEGDGVIDPDLAVGGPLHLADHVR